MSNLKTYNITHYQGLIGNTEWWNEKNWENHKMYIKRLKETGEYLKPVTIQMTLKHNPLFDEPSLVRSESCKLVVLDFSKTNHE